MNLWYVSLGLRLAAAGHDAVDAAAKNLRSEEGG
jgi:hypothetical protein